MADPKAMSSTTSTREIMDALQKQFPQYMSLLNSQVLPQALTELGAARAVSPEYQQLMTDLYGKYAPQLGKIGSDVERQQRLAGAETDVDILKGPGTELAIRNKEVDKLINPEQYKVREQAGSKLGELLSSINLNDPNIEAERLVSQEAARSGNLATPSATSTTANALSFGKEQQKRRDALGNAIGTATGFLSGTATPNVALASTGKSASGTGLSQFGGVTKPGDTAYSQGSGFLGNTTGLRTQQLDIEANRRDVFDRINEGISGGPNVSY